MNPAYACLAILAMTLQAAAFTDRHQPVDPPPGGPAATVLIPRGATWRYLDDGRPPDPAWPTIGFDDSAWKAGPAELGYGDGDEATTIHDGGDELHRYITTYFRHTFSVGHRGDIRFLRFWMRRDDGAVVYLNGQEIWRENMREGPVTSSTPARFVIGGNKEGKDLEYVIPGQAIRDGENVLAVEMHQVTPISSDLSFDFSATAIPGDVTPQLERGPYLQGGSPTSAVVCWRMDLPVDGWVRYGDAPDRLDRRVESPGPQRDHQVRLTALTPETTYYYAIGSGEHYLSPPNVHYTLTTHPPAGAVRPVRFWVLGDSGEANQDARDVRQAFETWSGDRGIDFTLMLGDNAYVDGTDLEYQAAVFEMYPELLRNTVFWSTLGNHDGHSAPSVTETGPYYDIYRLPTQGESGGAPSGTEAYYSFDYANIHFVCLNSYDVDRTTNGAMYAWLQADLAQLQSEWLIAFWHHPPYSKGSHDSDNEVELIEMREVFLPRLEAAGLDLMLAGHSHSYERSKLIHGHYGSSPDLTLPMFLDWGSGRGDATGPAYRKSGPPGTVYTVAGSSSKVSGGTLNHPVMYISLNELGSLVVEINGNRLDAFFIGNSPKVKDSFTILKPAP